MVSLGYRAQLDSPLITLTRGRPFIRPFETVIEGVSNNVHQRLREVLYDKLIEFGMRTRDHNPDFLFELTANLPTNPNHSLEKVLERNHSNLHDSRLKLGQPSVKISALLVELGGHP